MALLSGVVVSGVCAGGPAAAFCLASAAGHPAGTGFNGAGLFRFAGGGSACTGFAGAGLFRFAAAGPACQ